MRLDYRNTLVLGLVLLSYNILSGFRRRARGSYGRLSSALLRHPNRWTVCTVLGGRFAPTYASGDHETN